MFSIAGFAWNTAFIVCHPRRVLEYWMNIRKLPSIAQPKTVHDKYLWRKIIDRDPEFVRLSDKLQCKQYMQEHFPNVRCAKLLWRGTDIRNAPRELLEGPGFLKANHASALNFKLGESPLDVDALHSMTQGWLKVKWQKMHGEWAYSEITPELLIEEELTVPGFEDPVVDVTTYVFGQTVTHYSMMTEHKTQDTVFARIGPAGERLPEVPYPNKKMERIALKGYDPDKNRYLPDEFTPPGDVPALTRQAIEIGKDFDHMRVDFFWNGEEYCFLELTIYSRGGFVLYSDQDLLKRMNDAWDLRRSWFLQTPQSGWRKHYAEWLARRLC